MSRNIRITDSVYVRPWLGASPGRNKKDSDNQQSKIVYVAENGVVYHQSESCSYLKLSIRQCRQEDIQALRNKYGAKYVQCERCGKHAAGNETVYNGYGKSMAYGSHMQRTEAETSDDDAG